jgi:hypothetical protein
MPARLFMARLFLIGGGLLAVIGLILWVALPISTRFPPYLATVLLALGYGVFCWKPGLFSGARKP